MPTQETTEICNNLYLCVICYTETTKLFVSLSLLRGEMMDLDIEILNNAKIRSHPWSRGEVMGTN